MTLPPTIIVRGVDYVTDQVFMLETVEGEIVWNVSKLQRAAAAGEFGVPRECPTVDLPPPRYDLGNIDRAKIVAIKKRPDVLDRPAIAIESPNPNFAFWCFADGQHRITARQELKLPTFSTFIVPLAVEKRFRITQTIIEGGRP